MEGDLYQQSNIVYVGGRELGLLEMCNCDCGVLSPFFFSSRRRHTRFDCDWSSDVCSSDLRTASPLVNATLYFGASSLICRRIARTSPSVSGVGLFPLPTKLVTPGVLRTTYHEDRKSVV